jgi:transcriptional regulator GlxA family with amidase domain
MRHRPPVIAFLVPSSFELLDFTGPASVFQIPTLKRKPYYAMKVLSTEAGGSIKTTCGITIGNVCKYSDYVEQIDTLIVTGGEGAITHQPPELLNWIRERAVYTRRIATICTGAFILAGTGLLDGRRVATHWRYCDLLKSRYKGINVERDPIFLKDGKFYSTAGVSAGIDLALALVEEDLGHSVAAKLARELVLFLRRPGGQSQYSTLLAQQEGIKNASMRDLPVWVKAHLSRKLGVESLARAVRMSSRTFVRQFKTQFDTTPARWIQRLRVEAVMQHLDNDRMPLSKIALITGFRDEQAMKRAFLRETALTPRQYRDRFGRDRTSLAI